MTQPEYFVLAILHLSFLVQPALSTASDVALNGIAGLKYIRYNFHTFMNMLYARTSSSEKYQKEWQSGEG